MAKSKEKKPKKGFMDGYKTYDDRQGRGSRREWRNAWEEMSHGDAEAALNKLDPLEVMGFQSMPTKAELDARYRELVKKHHPDMGGDAEEFKKVQAAWTLLTEKL